MADESFALEWRPVQGFPVEISENGTVRRTIAKGRWPVGHIIHPFTKPGSSTIFISLTANDGARPLILLDELVAKVWLGPSPYEHAVVAHKDGDLTNFHWRNLKWEPDPRYGDGMESRKWAIISEFPLYEVSNDGHVRKSLLSGDQFAGRHLTPWFLEEGYTIVRLYRADGTHQDHSMHRLVAKAFLPLEEGRDHVAHRDGRPVNNRVDNLRWSTCKENMADRIIHGTAPIGAKHARAKLTDDLVKKIRRDAPYLGKGGIVSLASELGVSATTISNVIAGRIWKHVEVDEYLPCQSH